MRNSVDTGNRFITTLSLALFLFYVPTAGAASADRLVVCDDIGDPLTLDPHKEFSEKNHTILQQIYEGLVRFGPDAKIEPALALSWERVGPLRMRFHLRDNVRFHNGEAFNAEAVRYSIERILDPRTKSPGIVIVGTIDHAEVVDPLTIDVVTRMPDGLLLNRLAAYLLIIPPAYLKAAAESFPQKPVGTGPFQFVSWEKGKQIELRANPNYWMPGYPKLGELVFRFIPEDKKLAALFAKEVDVVTNVPGSQTLVVQRNPNTKIIKEKTLFTSFPHLNVASKPFSDIRVRQAVNLAIDKDELIRYDLLGNGELIASLSMPEESGHNADLRPYPFDQTKAKALLSEAGYSKGFTVEAGGNSNAERTAKIISGQLAKIGIKVNYHLSNDAQMLKDFAEHHYQMSFGGVPDPMADTYFIQSIVLYSKSPYSLAKNPEYDAKLEEMASTIDNEKRAALARTLDKYIHDQALAIFTYQRIQTHAVRKSVDFVPAATGMPYFFLTQYHHESPTPAPK